LVIKMIDNFNEYLHHTVIVDNKHFTILNLFNQESTTLLNKCVLDGTVSIPENNKFFSYDSDTYKTKINKEFNDGPIGYLKGDMRNNENFKHWSNTTFQLLLTNLLDTQVMLHKLGNKQYRDLINSESPVDIYDKKIIDFKNFQAGGDGNNFSFISPQILVHGSLGNLDKYIDDKLSNIFDYVNKININIMESGEINNNNVFDIYYIYYQIISFKNNINNKNINVRDENQILTLLMKGVTLVNEYFKQNASNEIYFSGLMMLYENFYDNNNKNWNMSHLLDYFLESINDQNYSELVLGYKRIIIIIHQMYIDKLEINPDENMQVINNNFVHNNFPQVVKVMTGGEYININNINNRFNNVIRGKTKDDLLHIFTSNYVKDVFDQYINFYKEYEIN